MRGGFFTLVGLLTLVMGFGALRCFAGLLGSGMVQSKTILLEYRSGQRLVGDSVCASFRNTPVWAGLLAGPLFRWICRTVDPGMFSGIICRSWPSA